eukprot:6340-Heterococcus_DN1.PRE.2
MVELLRSDLPSDVGNALADLWCMVGVQSSSGVAGSTGCDLKQLMTHIELTVVPALNLVNRKLDKKSEKQLLATQQH